MNQARLERLITVLEGVKAAGKAFDLTAWVTPAEDFGDTTTGSQQEARGTAACALGYAALDPEFQAEGLVFEARVCATGEKFTVTDITGFNAILRESNAEDRACRFEPRFGDSLENYAGSAFFGITYDAANYLFDPDYYADGYDRPVPPDEVIERVREVIALGGLAPPSDSND